MKKLGLIICSGLVVLVTAGGWMGGTAARGVLNHELKGEWPFSKYLDGKTYVVLLQNNTELRATGGFMGSYARIETDRSGIKKMEIQDIYQPDGQIAGHVEPPYPVQEAFRQGWWRLRDSNWDPDFASAAATVAWFLEQGGEKRVDGIIAVNLGLVQKWLEVLGEVKTVSYGEVVTAKNLYSLAQKYAEVNHDKRDFLGAVGEALVWKTKQIGPIGLIKLINLIYKELNKRQILAWIKGESFEQWEGRLGEAGNGDYLYIVESNLGANKANCCIIREVTQEVMGRNEKVTIKWENENEFSDPRPPVFWGGNYIDYVRVIIPEGAQVQGIRVAGKELRRARGEDFEIPNSTRQERSEDMYVIEKRGDLQIVGFWAVVPTRQTISVEIKYTFPGKGESHKILVKRQPGMEGFAYKLIYDGKLKINRWVDKDMLLWY